MTCIGCCTAMSCTTSCTLSATMSCTYRTICPALWVTYRQPRALALRAAIAADTRADFLLLFLLRHQHHHRCYSRVQRTAPLLRQAIWTDWRSCHDQRDQILNELLDFASQPARLLLLFCFSISLIGVNCWFKTAHAGQRQAGKQAGSTRSFSA